jgi:hypothetical protein
MNALSTACVTPPSCFRIVNGGPNFNIATFAANCRTSQDIMDRYYLSRPKAEMDKNLVRQGPVCLGRQI